LHGDYPKASASFLRFAKASTGEAKDRGLYMEAKSQAAAKQYDAAAATYEGLFSGAPGSPFAAAALYAYAGVLADQGLVDKAAVAYGRVASDYPQDPLAASALYRRAESLYQLKQYGAAQTAFTDYRLRFPDASKVDAALYWGGRAAYDAGEDFGAVLLWNQLIRDHENSPLRPDAMQRVAAIYAKRGDFQRALTLYKELLVAYPSEAKTVGAAYEVQKIEYLLQGQSSQEAALLVQISKDGGAESAAGRTEMIDLARIYLYGPSDKAHAALPLLDAVVGKWSVDPANAAQAQYYIGEYYYRKGDLPRAANEFLVASTLDTANHDLTAASMYRAAEAANASGNSSDARQLVGRIERMFPGTEWATEAKRILGGVSQ
jgi:TolA-binding protein